MKGNIWGAPSRGKDEKEIQEKSEEKVKRGPSFNPLMPSGSFNICCPRDCVSRHNGGTSGAPLKPLRVDSAPLGINGLSSTDYRAHVFS